MYKIWVDPIWDGEPTYRHAVGIRNRILRRSEPDLTRLIWLPFLFLLKPSLYFWYSLGSSHVSEEVKIFCTKKGSFYPALYTSTLSVVFTGNRFLFSSIQICQRVYTGNSISIKEVIWFGQGFLIYFSLHPMFHVWWTRSVSSSYLSISKSVHFLVLFSPVLRWSRWSKVVFFPVVPQYTGMATEEWVCGKEALTLTKTLSFISYTSILRDFFPPL